MTLLSIRLVMAFDRADTIIQRVAEQEGAQLIDVRKELNGRDEYFVDHVHLTREGSDKLARVVAKELKK